MLLYQTLAFTIHAKIYKNNKSCKSSKSEKSYKNKKSKELVLKWNEEFELSEFSYSV